MSGHNSVVAMESQTEAQRAPSEPVTLKFIPDPTPDRDVERRLIRLFRQLPFFSQQGLMNAVAGLAEE